MSKGIIFRRNKKSELFNIQPAEVVYAVDTNEWGLGLNDNSVSWRKHVVDFENIILFGSGSPNLSLGEIGFVYVDTNDILGIYIKGFSGWEYKKHPLGREFIDENFQPKTVGYDETFSLFTQDATQFETDDEYDIVNDLDVLNVKQLAQLVGGVLQDDGSTQMDDGYIPETDLQVVTKGNLNTEVSLVPPTTMPTTVGVLWNNNGVLSISSAPKICSGVSHYRLQFAENPENSYFRGYVEGSHGSLTLLSGQDLGITKIDMIIYEANAIDWTDAMDCFTNGKRYDVYDVNDVFQGSIRSNEFNGSDIPIFGNAVDTTLVEFKIDIVDDV